MRQGSIRLGRIMGIPLSMDLGVLLIGGLLTWVLATMVLPNGSPGLVSMAYWSVGALGALLFLGSLLAHEMAHAIVARRNDVAVEGITLWMFGGFAQFRTDPHTPGADFRITAAGPATSIGLGGLFGAVAWGLAGEAVDDDKLAARLAEYCDQLCAWSPVTLRLLKRVMGASMASTDMQQQLRYEVANIRLAFASEDSKEARKAFLEKRKPEFKGK